MPDSAPLRADSKYVTGLSGMTLAIPGTVIMELLDMPEIKNHRELVVENVKRRFPEQPISESAAAPMQEGNPRHKEDSTALLGAAAKAKPRDG
jgi:hypothetical protein